MSAASALDALRNADLAAALEQLKADVRKAPQEARHRIFLFQLFAVVGDWDRALTQLNVARELDPNALAMAQAYQEALHCEALRERVFAGQKSPLLFGEPEPWMAQVLEALKLSTAGQHEQAQQLRQEAFEQAKAVAGELQLRPTEQAPASAGAASDEERPGVPFAWIADADSRLGPMLEAVLKGRYYWIPLQRIRQVDFEAPTDLRDLVWLPAHFTWSNGGEAVGMVPTRYADSQRHADDLVRLARKTEWLSFPGEAFHGAGQRILATDQDEYPLLQVAQIRLEHEEGPGAAEGPGE